MSLQSLVQSLKVRCSVLTELRALMWALALVFQECAFLVFRWLREFKRWWLLVGWDFEESGYEVFEFVVGAHYGLDCFVTFFGEFVNSFSFVPGSFDEVVAFQGAQE